jgi:hypothetical protein
LKIYNITILLITIDIYGLHSLCCFFLPFTFINHRIAYLFSSLLSSQSLNNDVKLSTHVEPTRSIWIKLYSADTCMIRDANECTSANWVSVPDWEIQLNCVRRNFKIMTISNIIINKTASVHFWMHSSNQLPNAFKVKNCLSLTSLIKFLDKIMYIKLDTLLNKTILGVSYSHVPWHMKAYYRGQEDNCIFTKYVSIYDWFYYKYIIVLTTIIS